MLSKSFKHSLSNLIENLGIISLEVNIFGVRPFVAPISTIPTLAFFELFVLV